MNISSLGEIQNKPNIWEYIASLRINAVGPAEQAHWEGFYHGLKWLLKGQQIFVAIPDHIDPSVKNAELNGFWASIHGIDPTYINYKAGSDFQSREAFFRDYDIEISI